MDTLWDGPLVLVGAGKMGGAMLTGWLAEGLSPSRILVQDPAPAAEIAELLSENGINSHSDVTSVLAEPPAVLLMAVKPQIMDTVFPPLAKIVGADSLVLSIAAGRTIQSFAEHLSPDRAIVRTIPNTPAAIGRGITVCVANDAVTGRQRAICDALLSAIGEVGWVDDEGLIDVATAVSGSGPAYVFLLAECLAAAGVEAGLDPALAAQLAESTVAGSGELMRKSGISPETLRENVTSPNGTTHAALQVLMGTDGMQQLMSRAVTAASRRSRELAG
ncbi:MAG: pyrroline-5-carboxylate reductase [Hyphomicrobiaceae bacterium]